MEEKFTKGIDHVGVAVAFFCHDGKGNILMAKRSKNTRDEHGKWDIGAGAIEMGDTIEETLKKEIKEEYCADILKSEFLGYRTVLGEHNGKNTHWVMIDFKVQLDSKTVKNGEPHKFDDLRWFTFNSLPKPEEMHSKVPNFIEKYKGKLIEA